MTSFKKITIWSKCIHDLKIDLEFQNSKIYISLKNRGYKLFGASNFIKIGESLVELDPITYWWVIWMVKG